MDHTDKAWLEYHYCTLKESTYRIGELVGKTAPTIAYWLNKLGIPTRTRNEARLCRPPMKEETKKKISSAQKGEKSHWFGKTRSAEQSEKLSAALTGRKFTPEWRAKISKTRKERGTGAGKNNPMYGVSCPWAGKQLPEEMRKKISESHKGKNNPMYGRTKELCPSWKGGKSFEPYCTKFNDAKKEDVRERFGRTCFICGAPENGRKLHVHHIDYNKVQGCKGQRWALLPLCHSCHTKTSNSRHYYFNLLINYWAMNHEITIPESQTTGFSFTFYGPY